MKCFGIWNALWQEVTKTNSCSGLVAKCSVCGTTLQLNFLVIVLHDFIVVEIEICYQIAILGSLASSRDDLNPFADAEGCQFADTLPTHDGAFLRSRVRPLRFVIAAIFA